jgi:hypothetical protein
VGCILGATVGSLDLWSGLRHDGDRVLTRHVQYPMGDAEDAPTRENADERRPDPHDG